MDTLCPLSISRNNSSPLWKAMSASWSDLRTSIARSIRNGNLAQPLDDIWIPCLGPLRLHLKPKNITTTSLSFSDLLDDTRQWDVTKLPAFFSEEVVPRILSVTCPEPLDNDDCLFWHKSAKHVFETKSAYEMIASPYWDPKHLIWEHIWTLPVPQRIRLFFWLAFKHKLVTNHERCRCFVSNQPLCPICHDTTETSLHVLRNCNTARAVWLLVLPPSMVNNFFQSDPQDWISANLKSHLVVTQWSLPWKVLFASITWQLWKN
ncbi:hypothetical protein HRI_003879600 [Hibiscus trionum]|uniref:Reverse transcriptase zinc-binding domain-containing protein n=1 Tax=Hibiscus trionum TaxID=183268 RepID=A0A9W7IVL5_HIBTR|nr:hypothetical protein HRI_003879600 [Hibiscus trionum]